MGGPEAGGRYAAAADDSTDFRHHGAENSALKKNAPSSLTNLRISDNTSIKKNIACAGV